MAAPPMGSLRCCAPQTIAEKCSEEAIDKTKLFSMVKMNCSFPQCDQSGFMHPECLQELEDYLNRYIKSLTFTNTHKNESVRKNLNQRDNIWKEKGMYGFIHKQLVNDLQCLIELEKIPAGSGMKKQCQEERHK